MAIVHPPSLPVLQSAEALVLSPSAISLLISTPPIVPNVVSPFAPLNSWSDMWRVAPTGEHAIYCITASSSPFVILWRRQESPKLLLWKSDGALKMEMLHVRGTWWC